jgi:hypothetical protein
VIIPPISLLWDNLCSFRLFTFGLLPRLPIMLLLPQNHCTKTKLHHPLPSTSSSSFHPIHSFINTLSFIYSLFHCTHFNLLPVSSTCSILPQLRSLSKLLNSLPTSLSGLDLDFASCVLEVSGRL